MFRRNKEIALFFCPPSFCPLSSCFPSRTGAMLTGHPGLILESNTLMGPLVALTNPPQPMTIAVPESTPSHFVVLGDLA